jgi:diguanylate cyclase (GGDEF)-like protein
VDILVPSVIAAAGVATAFLALLSARRRVRKADTRVTTAVDELTERMEAMLASLEQALSEAQADARRTRTLGDLSTSIDLDDVLARMLDIAAALPGVDAALVIVPADEGPALLKAVGLAEDEIRRQPVLGPPDGRNPRAVRVSYHYGEDELPGRAFIYGGVAVPLTAGAIGTGSLVIFTRSPSHQFGESEVRDLEEIATRGAPALVNALRFREVKQLADIDALTRLYNRRVFHETLAREVARARRYERQLALVIFDLDDFKDVNERLGHLQGDAVLADVADRIRAAVRSADIACRVGGDEFAVVLPESKIVDGVKLSERLQAAIASPPIVQAGRLGISAGVAELTGGDDARTLFERADQNLYQAKGEGKGRVVSGFKSSLGSA